MHEMSIVTSILSLVREEMCKHGVTRLYKVRICCGELSNVVPDALTFAFEALTAGTELEGAVLETERVPLTLRCGACGQVFAPEEQRVLATSCPVCYECFGHVVVTGRELHLQHLEAE